jgi:hypothetical protein
LCLILVDGSKWLGWGAAISPPARIVAFRSAKGRAFDFRDFPVLDECHAPFRGAKSDDESFLSFVPAPVRVCPFPPSAADTFTISDPALVLLNIMLAQPCTVVSRVNYIEANDRLHRPSNAPGMMPDQNKLIRTENLVGSAAAPDR